jgi:hypothetical protein
MLCVKCGAKIKIAIHKRNDRFYIRTDSSWIKINPDAVYILCDGCEPIEKGEVT